jgi:biopolymer transport protein ExbD
VAVRLPEAADLPGITGPTLTVVVDANRRLYFRNQVIRENDLLAQLRKAARETKESPVLVLMADRTVSYDTIIHLTEIARAAGLKETLLTTSPPATPARRQAAP